MTPKGWRRLIDIFLRSMKNVPQEKKIRGGMFPPLGKIERKGGVARSNLHRDHQYPIYGFSISFFDRVNRYLNDLSSFQNSVSFFTHFKDTHNNFMRISSFTSQLIINQTCRVLHRFSFCISICFQGGKKHFDGRFFLLSGKRYQLICTTLYEEISPF